MPFEIVDSSPKASNLIAKASNVGAIKYPFAMLEKGQSFTIPLKDAKIKSLRELCRQYSTAEKKFRVVRHNDKKHYVN
jgi:hypothetical protein